MGMLLEAEIVIGPHFFHQVKQIVITAKEDMQTHFDMVAIPIDPTAHLAANKTPRFIQFHFMTRIHQFHSGCHSR